MKAQTDLQIARDDTEAAEQEFETRRSASKAVFPLHQGATGLLSEAVLRQG